MSIRDILPKMSGTRLLLHMYILIILLISTEKQLIGGVHSSE